MAPPSAHVALCTCACPRVLLSHALQLVDYAPMAIRRSALQNVGWLDETLADPGECGIWSDWEISTRLWLAGWQVRSHVGASRTQPHCSLVSWCLVHGVGTRVAGSARLLAVASCVGASICDGRGTGVLACWRSDAESLRRAARAARLVRDRLVPGSTCLPSMWVMVLRSLRPGFRRPHSTTVYPLTCPPPLPALLARWAPCR